MKYIRRVALCVLGIVGTGCVSAGSSMPRESRAYRRSALSPIAYSLAWAMRNSAIDSIAKPRIELGSDQSVGTGGILGNTVNEVVPIPGTDMVKAGVLQEGSLFQSNFRSPQQETNGQSGSILTSATIVFRVFRPIR